MNARMHCTCSRAPIHDRASLGRHGRPWIWQLFGWISPMGHAREAIDAHMSCTCARALVHARASLGGHGFRNFRTGHHHQDALGRPCMHTCTLHVHVHLYMLKQAWEAREAMDLVTFELDVTTGTRSGGHTCTHALHMFTCTYTCSGKLGR